jgi:hypothetical protein
MVWRKVSRKTAQVLRLRNSQSPQVVSLRMTGFGVRGGYGKGKATTADPYGTTSKKGNGEIQGSFTAFRMTTSKV